MPVTIVNPPVDSGQFVEITGDTMTGNLELGDAKLLILQSMDSSIVIGNPIGPPPFLWMTYAANSGSTKRWGVSVEHATGALVTTEL